MAPDVFIGTDIVEVSRIRELIKSHPDRFLEKTYTSKEQNYCNSKSAPTIHFAGRFAAKEAIKKALMTSGVENNISWVDMEVIADEDGKPIVHLHNLPELNCKVSISHTNDIAIASALIIK